MNIFLVGEAAEHVDDLRPHLADPHQIIGLPWAAASSNTFDDDITADDVVIAQDSPQYPRANTPGTCRRPGMEVHPRPSSKQH